MADTKELQNRFVEIYNENISRPGADKLLDFLLSENSDFFVAPASSEHNGAYEGGLCEHSINVYECLKDYLERNRVKDEYGLEYPDETVAIVSLLHDLCKINLYRTGYRNVQNEYGEWEDVPYFEQNDTLPYGHGEKSVYIINGFMKLTREETMAVRWHMGF